jgi:hypothetical protein
MARIPRHPSVTALIRVGAAVGALSAIAIAVLVANSRLDSDRANTISIALFVAIALFLVCTVPGHVVSAALSRVKTVQMFGLHL